MLARVDHGVATTTWTVSRATYSLTTYLLCYFHFYINIDMFSILATHGYRSTIEKETRRVLHLQQACR